MAGTLRDDGAYFIGEGYALLNNTWGRRDLVNGVDYTQTIAYDQTADNVTFAWDWPVVSPRHVLAYPEIFAGQSPWSGLGAAGSLPVQLSDIDSLSATFDLDWGGDTSLFNVSFDLWLSSDPAGGRDAITHEVMIWLKSAEFSPGGKIVDIVSVQGLTAEFRYKDAAPAGWPKWSYAAFQAQEEMSAGRIDIDALLDHLIAEEIAAPDLWLMNVELGAEIVGGAGWLRIEGFDVAVDAAPPLTGTHTTHVEPTRISPDLDDIGWGLTDLIDIAF